MIKWQCSCQLRKSTKSRHTFHALVVLEFLVQLLVTALLPNMLQSNIFTTIDFAWTESFLKYIRWSHDWFHKPSNSINPHLKPQTSVQTVKNKASSGNNTVNISLYVSSCSNPPNPFRFQSSKNQTLPYQVDGTSVFTQAGNIFLQFITRWMIASTVLKYPTSDCGFCIIERWRNSNKIWRSFRCSWGLLVY